MDKICWRYIAHVLDPGFITLVTKKSLKIWPTYLSWQGSTCIRMYKTLGLPSDTREINETAKCDGEKSETAKCGVYPCNSSTQEPKARGSGDAIFG